MAVQYIVSTGGDPSLFVSSPPAPAVGIPQGPPGQFPQFPSWATFQNANLPSSVIVWLLLVGALVVTMRLTLRLQS